MILDITQEVTGNTPYRQGSPTLKVEEISCVEYVQGQAREYTTTFFSSSTHNMGTHIDTMGSVNIEPSRMIGKGVKYDVSNATDKVIGLDCIDLSLIEEGCYVLFQTNWDRYVNDSKYYNHPEIDIEVIRKLIELKVNMVGIDAMGLGYGSNHSIIDNLLADNKIYAIENLTNLSLIPTNNFTVYCLPLKISSLDALPARILVEYEGRNK